MLIEQRSLADVGHFYTAEVCPETGRGYWLYETSVARSGEYEMMVCISQAPQIEFNQATQQHQFVPCTLGLTRIRYALRTPESSSWTAAFLNPFDPLTLGAKVEDPCIVAGGLPGEFVIVAKTEGSILRCRFSVETGAQPWEVVYAAPPQAAVDKPWIVKAGTDTYDLTFFGVGAVGLRLYSWSAQQPGTGGSILVDGTAQGTAFCPHPAWSPMDERLYVVQRSGTVIRILEQAAGLGVDFEYLRSSATEILALTTSTFGFPQGNCLPVPAPIQSLCEEGYGLRSSTVPQLIADPGVPGRLFLVRNDVGEGGDPSDVDVICQRIERGNEYWALTDEVRIPACSPPPGCSDCVQEEGPCQHPDAPDPAGNRPDQFCPAGVVDRFSRVHLLFYSNARTCGIAEHGRRYDVYYALSNPGGGSFQTWSLRTCVQRPGLDFDVDGVKPDWSPREYNGIALDDSDTNHTFVTVSYAGVAYGPNTTIDPTAIYAHVVRVANPIQ